MTNSTRCTLLAKQACTTLSHVVQKITPPSANNFLKLVFALFAMLALGVGNAWGAVANPYVHTFASGEVKTTAQNAKVLDGVTWSISSATYVGFDNTKGVQIGSGNKPQNSTAWTMSTPISSFGENIQVTKVEIAIATASSGGVTYTITAGDQKATATLGATTTVTTKSLDCSANPVSTGTLTISLLSTKSKAVYIKSVKVTYETVSGSTETVLSSIKISGDLTDKTYEEGEELDFSGLTVQANYENGDPKDVTNEVEWSYTPNPLTKGTTSVEVTATYEDKTATQTINGLIVNEHIITPGAYDITLNNVFFGTTASTNITGPVTGKKDDITITINGTGSTKPRTDATYTRFYASSTMAISVPSGYVIKSIAITKNENDYANPSVTIGAFDNSTKTWTGNANSVTMSFNAKSFINSIKVTYAADVKYALNITTPSNGTLVVKDGENTLASGAEIYEGTKLTVTATPETGYEEGVVVVKNASDEDVTADVYDAGTLTMPAYAVTISATFENKPCTLLTTPVVTATPTYNSATLTWAVVANAAKYSVTVGETTTEVTEPTFTATGLNAETTYTYQVQAIAEAEQDTYCDSEVAKGSFTTSAAPVVTLTLKTSPITILTLPFFITNILQASVKISFALSNKDVGKCASLATFIP